MENILPIDFLLRMETMLESEYPQFLASYDREKRKSLRLNLLKKAGVKAEDVPFSLRPVKWEETGFYYADDDTPGKHPLHEAGLYYIQEASAMAPVHYLDPQPGERILDLCAAPGGKSTQIAVKMRGEGILVSNEIHPVRAQILSGNMERMGVRNAIVTNENAASLSRHFGAYFDRILVDAPCSGEGMFIKNEGATNEWSLENVKMCAERQDEILDEAAKMLKAGGTLVFSTCTFAPEENEGSISRMLERHPEFTIERVDRVEGMEPGRPEWILNPAPGLENTIRLWPHKLEGEGHFLSVLKKNDDHVAQDQKFQKGISAKEYADYMQFEKDFLKIHIEGIPICFGEQLYMMPKDCITIDKLKVVRPGLHLGTLKKGRFEPSHSLAMALRPEEVRYSYDCEPEKEIRQYLEGQALRVEGEKGWYLVTVNGVSTGWGKLSDGVMKNHYPKGLRKLLPTT